MPTPPSHPRIPESLRPYIRLTSRDSLTLVTGVLGATTNWIVLRFVAAAVAVTGATASAATAAHEKNGPGGVRAGTSKEGGGGGGVNESGGDERFGVEGSKRDSMVQSQGQGQGQKQVAVVLVSWMRDLEFWWTEGMKVVGIDIARLVEQGRFAFVDGLKELFTGSDGSEDYSDGKNINQDVSTAASRARSSIDSSSPSGTLSSSTSSSAAAVARTLPLPNRGSLRLHEEQRSLPVVSQSRPFATSTTSREEHFNQSNSPTTTISSRSMSRSKSTTVYSLKSPTLPHLEETVSQAIASLAEPKSVLLILDNPDLFLAATSTSAISLINTIQQLRSHAKIHSTIVTLAADGPLLFPANQHATHSFTDPNATTASPSSLQSHHATLVTGLAHHASSILSVRLLDTGFAGDVSGVLRVGVGGGAGIDRRKKNEMFDVDEDGSDHEDINDDYEDGEEEIDSGLTNTGKEMLYFISAGGDVKV